MLSAALQRYQFIDALRGFAILGVVMVHTAQWIVPGSDWLDALATQGARGVQLFFLASALTLFMSMNARGQRDRRPYLSFALRRLFRIAPLFYLAVVIYTLYFGFGPRYWGPNGIDSASVVLTALFLHGWHPETITSVVPGGWSIAVEMTFYLFVPLLFMYLTNIKRTLIALAGALALDALLAPLLTALLAPHYPQQQQYLVEGFTFFWFFSQLPVFLLGILLYHLILRRAGGGRRLGLACLLLAPLMGTGLLLGGQHLASAPTHVLYGVVFMCFGFGLYLLPTRLLVNQLTRGLGTISYSLYLTHFAVIYLLRDFVFVDLALAGDLHLAAGFTGVLALSTAVSYCSYRLVEKPGVRLGASLIECINGSRRQRHRVQRDPQFTGPAKLAAADAGAPIH